MKFSLFSATIFAFVASSNAIPLAVDYMVERAHNIGGLTVREWIQLETRTGSFATTNAATKHAAHEFIDVALEKSKIAEAAAPSHNTKTYFFNDAFHLDRQQPTNAHGDHKVAIQQNKGQVSTIGQVVINKDHVVSPATVAAMLKHSVNIGKELRVPDSEKAKRIAANHAKHLAKQQRQALEYMDGMASAAKGEFKKGKK